MSHAQARLGLIRPFPKQKLWAKTKLKALADDKSNVAKLPISLFDRVENIVGKGENVGYQHFLLSPQSFQKTSLLGLLKVGIVWYRINSLPNNISKLVQTESNCTHQT